MLRTTRQDVLHHGGVFHIPCRAPGERVARMPTDGDDATILMMLDDLVVYTGEGHTVEIFGIAHLYSTEVETHDRGIVARDGEDIAFVGIPFPCHAIHGSILMTRHISFLVDGVESLVKLFGECGVVSLFGCGTSHEGDSCESHGIKYFFHCWTV